MSYICLDASVVFKFVVAEPDSAFAEQLWADCLDKGVTAVAPLTLPFEVFSAIRRRVCRGLLSSAKASMCCLLVSVLPINYVHHSMLMLRALNLATEHSQATIYDAMYLAVAETYGCDFWTADERFYNTVAPHAPFVHLLANYSSTVSP